MPTDHTMLYRVEVSLFTHAGERLNRAVIQEPITLDDLPSAIEGLKAALPRGAEAVNLMVKLEGYRPN
jgi:hypothetical protein